MLRSLGDWLLPPAGPLLLALIGLAALRTRGGRWLLAIGVLSLYLLSLPWVAYALMAPLQQPTAPVALEALEGAGAIVVLGAGYRGGADEYSGETVNAMALVRLRYAAWLHHRTGMPVLATGGGPEDRLPEAHYMAEVLEEFGVASILREEQARDTWGNAVHSAAMLRENGVTRVALVTHAHHMPRAGWAFRQAGVDFVPAPTGALVPGDTEFTLGTLRPHAHAIYMSWLAVHEYLGMAWYRWRYRSEDGRSQ